jgi:hypothetical protein
MFCPWNLDVVIKKYTQIDTLGSVYNTENIDPVFKDVHNHVYEPFGPCTSLSVFLSSSFLSCFGTFFLSVKEKKIPYNLFTQLPQKER